MELFWNLPPLSLLIGIGVTHVINALVKGRNWTVGRAENVVTKLVGVGSIRDTQAQEVDCDHVIATICAI